MKKGWVLIFLMSTMALGETSSAVHSGIDSIKSAIEAISKGVGADSKSSSAASAIDACLPPAQRPLAPAAITPPKSEREPAITPLSK